MSLPTRSVEAVVASLDALPAGFHRAVATDADGTLWSTDVGDELFTDLAERHDFRGSARDGLRERARAWLDPDALDDLALAHALMAFYRAGTISIGDICALQAEAVGERSEDDLAQLYARVAARVAATVRPEVRALLQTLTARGFTVHVVSGSLGDAVAACMRAAELPHTTVAGATLARDGAWVQGRCVGEIPLFEGKVRALSAAGAWPAALGLGDGGWDVTFLRDVFAPVLVHPKPALLDAMAGHTRAVVIG